MAWGAEWTPGSPGLAIYVSANASAIWDSLEQHFALSPQHWLHSGKGTVHGRASRSIVEMLWIPCTHCMAPSPC